jgi:hypothetical protein
MSHDCIKRVNEHLAAHNTELASAISFSNPKAELIQITTTKRDAKLRGKPMNMFASFCPFCGAKLEGSQT